MDKKEYNKTANEGTIEMVLDEGETVLWRAKPIKKAFILNSSLGMAPFALLWLLIDAFVIGTIVSTSAESGDQVFWWLLPFFAIHLMPVWIWLGMFITAFRRFKNTEYAITDKRLIIKSGFLAVNFESIAYSDVQGVNVHIGLIDRITHVGDVIIARTGGTKNSKGFMDIEDPYGVYKMLSKIARDISTDMQYPNALRPENNPGYKTGYKPDDNK